MKIGFANRFDCLTRIGGDTVQMLKTKDYIEKLYPNVEIEIYTDPEELKKAKNIDLIHIFNIQTSNETQKFINVAKEKKIKTVLSTIYWDLSTSTYIDYSANFGIFATYIPNILQKALISIINFFVLLIPNLKMKYKNGIEKGLYGTKKNIKAGQKILLDVDYLLPNSPEELDCIAKYFKIDKSKLTQKTIIIPNAVDFELTEYEYEFPKNIKFIKNLKNIVIEAARIEPLKNQLNVVNALINYPEIPIVFVGRVISQKYFNQLKKISEKRGNVYFIEHVDRKILFEIYKRATVHVLPSFRESPGLSSLEARFFNCQIVVSDQKFCPIKYYDFAEIGYICDPFSPKSIKHSILKAIKSPKPDINNSYKEQFSYNNVAKMTFDAYITVLCK